MADGSRTQNAFNFPVRTALSKLAPDEIIVDLFAGGGGASEAIRQALGRDPDIAINHDEEAIGMHAANHPLTRHMREDIWQADPVHEVAGRRVGLLHASPDCTHHSQARGGQPRSKAVRSLAWSMVKWAGKLNRVGCAPRLITGENVVQWVKWGPLVAKRCPKTGRVVTLDMVACPETGRMINRVADKGERVPVRNQFLVPDKKREGRTWRHFIAALRNLGYQVEYRALRACDYGAGTSRERLFLFARRDGQPLVWPAPTHGDGPGLQKVVAAADCLDWSIPCNSIFTRPKPLADATHRRITRGIKRFILEAPDPFIVPNNANNVPKPVTEPVPTITTGNRNLLTKPVLAPVMVQASHGEGRPGGVQRRGIGARAIMSPVPTITRSNDHALAALTLVQTGYGERVGQAPRALDLDAPLGTIVAGGVKHAVASAHLVKMRGESIGSAATAPVPTITSGAGAKRPAGAPHALGTVSVLLEQANGGYYDGPGHDVRSPIPTICSHGSLKRLVSADLENVAGDGVSYGLSPEKLAEAIRVAVFLVRNGLVPGQDDPSTMTAEELLKCVTVDVKGVAHVIVDIGLRMLKPHELYRSQGFPADYIIDHTADGRRLSDSAKVKMVGNSVSPPPLAALLRANVAQALDSAERIAA